MRLLAAIALLAALLLIAPTAAWSKDRPKPKQVKEKNDPYPPAFRKRIDDAVDNGVECLIGKQRSDGSWPAEGELRKHQLGVTALCTLACLKGGVKASDPQIRNAFANMRAQPLRKTYDVGVLLMAIHAKYSPLEALEDVETDKYGQRIIKDPCQSKMTKEDRAWVQKAVKFLLDNQKGGHWRYPEDGVDLSNTQYALLGLWSASRCGFKIPPKVWMDSMNWLLSVQERTGPQVKLMINEVRGDYRVAWTENARARGFRYRPENPISAAMTTAGMAGVAICQDELWSSRKFTPPMRQRTRRSIRDAMAWIQDNFDVSKNPGEPTGGWHYYYLYGLERAGILARMRFMGKWDWYKEGAEYLLSKQSGAGCWTREHTLLDTAFAILFLKRSTRRTRNPVITPN